MIWMELLERFQTSIAALVGFAGIIITIRANAKLAAGERKKIRLHEKEALIATLWGELTTIKDILDNSLAKFEHGGGPTDLICPVHQNSHGFVDQVGVRLGLLRKDTVSKTVQAYLAWREMPKKMILVLGSTSKIRDDYILVTGEQRESCKAILAATRVSILQALEALDQESTYG